MTTVAETSTVFIVEDETDMRRSLSRLLVSAGFRTETFENAEEFLNGYDANAVGCLLLDVRLGGMDGLELQAVMTTRGFRIPCIMISGYADVAIALKAMHRGAFAFLEKPLEDAELMKCVQEAIAQDETRRREEAVRHNYLDTLAALTSRQREVMDLLLVGMTTKQISFALGISVKTVDVHRRNVLRRFGVDDVISLVHLTYRCGIQCPPLRLGQKDQVDNNG